MPKPAPSAAKPSKSIFDPFNSSATGHQRADNRLSGSTSWRDSRNFKLRNQFNGGTGGGSRVFDTVGAGSLDFGKDGRTENGGWIRGAKGLRTSGQTSILESMKGIKVEKAEVDRPSKRTRIEAELEPTTVVNPFAPFRKSNGSFRESSWKGHGTSSDLLSPIDNPATAPVNSGNLSQANVSPPAVFEPHSLIFAHLTIYINGSTAPAISDHKLKHLLSNHGANLSIALGRRTVTHVIVGRPSSSGGSGGGLAGTKLQKEISRIGGKSVKFVTVDWVLDSVKAGKRMAEAKYSLPLAPSGVKSVTRMFGTTAVKSTDTG
nr:dna repair protein rev1 [Quercus suber]